MADRHNTHNGRDLGGHRRVRREDVDDVLEDVTGPDIVRDDVRLGGAVDDTGPDAGAKARAIGDLIDANRDDVRRVAGKAPGSRGKKGGRG